MKNFSVFNFIKSANLFFILCILVLQIIGLLSLYSVAVDEIFLFHKQLIWILLSWCVFFFIYSVNTSIIAKSLWFLFILNLLALIGVYFFGKEIYSAKRWLDFGFFYYQPSETLKLILLLMVAKKISQRPFGQIFNFIELLKLIIFIAIPVLIVLLQPDLGTAGIILLMIASLILFNGLEKKTLIGCLIVFMISIPIAWKSILKPYQKARITSFIKPLEDSQGTGYNVIQSKIAIGSGQILGKGWKQGTQNKLQFLPERHTDFIFSVLSEEYGFVGSSLTLLFFFLILFFTFNLARQTRDRLNCYFCLSAGFFLLWHVILNLAMTMGLFPVVGIPLPLLSYGGSHTITTMAFFGLIAGICKNKDLFQ
ncbi:MAG: rod shape-determining protein RodA [Bdellovibrionaceae bacterium]|nr:rod shape-determining protein RodA [Pseudobdellovibrionaceae bacterium]